MASANVVQAIGSSYHLTDIRAACQSAINCYVQKLDGTNLMLASAPGEAIVAAMGSEGRGSHVVQPGNRWFVASGNKLYEMTPDAADLYEATERGTLLTTSGYVGMAHNRDQLAVVDGDNLYILNLATNVLTHITADGWRGSDEVRELDGYFIFVDPETDQFYISAIDDGTNLDALDFSSADSSPDNILIHRVSHRALWLFGTDSAELWVDSGDPLFPFTRYNSYTLDVGCVGKRASTEAADTIFWVGKNTNGRGLVYMAEGNQPKRISNMAVEEALKAANDLTQVEMWAYQTEGHEFVGFYAPGMTSTWVFDAALNEWHERAEWDDGWAPNRSRHHVAFNGQHYAIDAFGNIVRLDENVNNLGGRPLVRERTWPHLIQPTLEPVSYFGLEVAAKTGNGGNITLEISNDGGYTWGPKLLRGLGAIGRRIQRIRWLGLGAATFRVFRLRCSDDVPFALYSATVST